MSLERKVNQGLFLHERVNLHETLELSSFISCVAITVRHFSLGFYGQTVMRCDDMSLEGIVFFMVITVAAITLCTSCLS